MVGRERIWRIRVDHESPTAALELSKLPQLVLCTSVVFETFDECIEVCIGDLWRSVSELFEAKLEHLKTLTYDEGLFTDILVLVPLEVGWRTSMLLLHFD